MTIVQFSIRGVELEEREGLISLTAIWKLAGSPGTLRPNDWKNFPSVVELAQQVAQELNTSPTCIYETRKGRGGGTWAHWKMALAYAASLDAGLYSEILETYRKVKEGDLTLAGEMVRRNYDQDALKQFQYDLKQHQLYLDSYWGVMEQLKAHGAERQDYQHYNGAVNRMIGVEKGKRHKMDRRQVLSARIIQDGGELHLMDSDAHGSAAVVEALDAGARAIRAIKGAE
jgi:hypothetical protein